MKISIEQIVVVDRIRKKFPSNEELKKSMAERGLINPLVISPLPDGKFKLVAGERRLISAKEIGWKDIECTLREEVDELTSRELELEENVCRADFTDEEKVKAVLEIHRLKTLKYGLSYKGNREGGWTVQDTADSLGISKSWASDLIKIGEVINRPDADAEVLTVLRKDGLKAAHKLHLTKQAEEVEKYISENFKPVPSSDPTIKVDAVAAAEKMYLLGDSTQLIKSVPTASIDMGFTDSPYGISIQELRKSNKAVLYSEDDVDKFTREWKMLCSEYMRVLKEDSFLFVWTGFSTHPILSSIAFEAGFKVCPVPFVWIRLGGSWQCNSPHLWPASAVEVAVILAKGNPMMREQGKPNFSLEPVLSIKDKIHPLEKPKGLILDILGRYLLPGQTVLDTYAGSGSTAAACVDAGYNCISFEIDETYYHAGKIRLVNLINDKYNV